MISHFRNFARSKWAIGLLGLMFISLVVVGGSQVDVFGGLGPKHVISAGDRSMDGPEFRTAMERVRNNLQEESGRAVTLQEMAAENIPTQFLDSQTQRRGFLAWAWNAGIRPGKELVLKEIRGIPAFFNQVTGQFDQDQYQQALAAQNVTPADLEQEFRDQYMIEHFGAGMFAGARAPRIYSALLAGQALETRDGRWFTVTQAMAGATPAPTDAQLTAFLNENADQLRRPEFRMASIVLFSPGPEAANAPIAEEAIRERFEFRKSTLSAPETRSFVTLTAPSRAVADRIAAALRAGTAVAEVGRANSVVPAELTDQPRSALSDPAVAAGVFGLGLNEVSAPIQGRVGFTVARVSAITPGREATLDGVRDEVVAELRAEAARGSTFEKVEAYERARQDGKTLAVAAQEVGARLVQLPPFTRDGRLPDQQQINAPPQIFETAYGLAKGGESEVIDAGQGQYFAVRLDDIRPAALPTLNDVRDLMTREWTNRENGRRLAARAEALAGQIRAGQDIAAVAASAGATVTSRSGVQQNQQAVTELGQGVARGLFGQGRGQVFAEANSQTSYVVGRVDAVRPAVPALAAPLAEQARPRITQDTIQAMTQFALEAGAQRVKAANNPELAREVLGLTDTPAAPGSAPGSTPTPVPAG